jgi:hypothetical protein
MVGCSYEKSFGSGYFSSQNNINLRQCASGWFYYRSFLSASPYRFSSFVWKKEKVFGFRQTQHLFYFILFYFVLFYFISIYLFYFVNLILIYLFYHDNMFRPTDRHRATSTELRTRCSAVQIIFFVIQ